MRAELLPDVFVFFFLLLTFTWVEDAASMHSLFLYKLIVYKEVARSHTGGGGRRGGGQKWNYITFPFLPLVLVLRSSLWFPSVTDSLCFFHRMSHWLKSHWGGSMQISSGDVDKQWQSWGLDRNKQKKEKKKRGREDAQIHKKIPVSLMGFARKSCITLEQPKTLVKQIRPRPAEQFNYSAWL